MRIAIMGSGGIGGYIGAKLAQASEDVTFIARGSHLAAMQAQGLCVESPLGEIKLPRVSDIDHVLRAKFITVSAFSGATSLMRCGIGPIFANSESCLFLEQLRDEGSFRAEYKHNNKAVVRRNVFSTLH